MDGNFNIISGKKIKPLIIEKVVVKAKRLKEKTDNLSAYHADEVEQI
eukprot:CAMPEP_0176425184 /NCGR_PEP_ID=MMETSP0127-20121128/11252_1 /TAXON_ID=938130 /ORGANISM="Platyophrya macrostoma, Strain WH" /LENGTH=46 /DNA_ID= /DNA_START= /DNA_END= /DNA_ORIENTATION=